MHLGQFVLFLLTLYISLDTAFGFTSTFGSASNPPESLRSIPLFVLLNIWPGAYGTHSLFTYVIRNTDRTFSIPSIAR